MITAEKSPRLLRGKYLIGTLLLSASMTVAWANQKSVPAHAAAPALHAAGPVGHPGFGPGGIHGGPGGFHGDHAFAHDVGPRVAFREHDVHRFGHDDLVRWRGGHWNRTCFDGRCGWWWFAGGQWYFYDSPIYPYPVVVSNVAYVAPVAAAPVIAVAAPLTVAPPPKLYYYCDNPPGYYPQVANCNTQFRQVAAPPH